jgi:hypothetical protein
MGKSKLNNASPEFGKSILGAVIERSGEFGEARYSEGGCVESSFASEGGAEIF